VTCAAAAAAVPETSGPGTPPEAADGADGQADGVPEYWVSSLDALAEPEVEPIGRNGAELDGKAVELDGIGPAVASYPGTAGDWAVLPVPSDEVGSAAADVVVAGGAVNGAGLAEPDGEA
jgi:hypothetical protein